MKFFKIILFTMLSLFSISSMAQSFWTYGKDTNPLTEKTFSYAMGLSEDGTTSAYVNCIDNYISVYFIFNEFLNDDSVDVSYRFDKNPIINSNWQTTSDGSGIFADIGLIMAAKLMRHKKFVLKVTDFRGVDYYAIFNLNGSKNAISKVIKSCN